MADRLPDPLRHTLDAFTDYLRVERGSAASTVKAYRRDVRRYLRFLAERDIDDLDRVRPADVADAMSSRAAEGVAATTLHRTLSAIRHLHRFCVRDGLTTSDPAALVDGPARGLSLPKALSVEEVEAILELLYAAGLRVSELTGLDVDDVDTDVRAVRCTGKGDKDRVVPIGRPAADAVEAYLRDGRPALVGKGRGSHALFLSFRGGRLSRQSVWKGVKRYASRVVAEDRVHPHVLRHSFATHLVARGADIRVVQEALGHARLSTTQVYTLVSRKQLKDAYEAAHPRGRGRGTSE